MRGPLGLAVGLLVVGLLTWRPMVAGAQTAGPDPLEDLSDPVTDVVEETTEAINEKTETVTQVVEDGASSATDTAVDASEVNDEGSGGSGSGGSTADTTSDSTGGGPAPTGGGSGRSTVANRFDPSYLVSPLIVSKTNDANRNGDYSDSEVAPSPGAAVSFRVELTNAGDVGLMITDIRDAFEEGFWRVDVQVCEELIGDRLPAKASVGCSFTLKDYAPEEGEKINTLHVTSVETAGPSARVIGSDTSTVLGSNVAVLGKVATNPLATTGAQIVLLLKTMLGFMIGGTLLVAAGRPREEAMLGSTRIADNPTAG